MLVWQLKPTDVAHPPAVVLTGSAKESLQEFHKKQAQLKAVIDNARLAFGPEMADQKIAEAEEQLRNNEKDMAELLKKFSAERNQQKQSNDSTPLAFESEIARLNFEWDNLKLYKNALQANLAQVDQESKKWAGAAIQIETVRDEITRQKAFLNDLAMKITKQEVWLGADSPVVSFQKAYAYPPPLIGKREMATGFGGVGLFLLILAAFAWLEFRARRVDSRDQVVQTFGLNYIGSLPDYYYRPRLGLLRTRAAEATHDRLLMDSVDAARTMLLSAAKEERLQIVMITSAFMGEGKTSTAGHLAASLARAGQKTLLIDGDLRKPSLHRLFKAEATPGVSEVLRGECAPANAAQPTGTDGLSLLSAGRFTAQTSYLLSEKSLQDMLEQFRSEYDFVILDTSPVLMVPEAQLFSQYADGVILSVMRNVSQLHKVHSSLDLLGRLRARVLGFILSGVRDEVYAGSNYYQLPSADAVASTRP
jgi:capsular exopolysaccharide synthesis family protein